MDGNVKPKRKVETLDQGNPQVYPGVCDNIVDLLICTAARNSNFSVPKSRRKAAVNPVFTDLYEDIKLNFKRL